ncbi:hypothetical protein JTB14_025026 [Gonioctena quinquepunctata]|nr:hypothetical protein JTB14_025026 [Gonioctena quinquepunctata]
MDIMMGDQAGLMGIVKLNGENWTTWKFQVKITIKLKWFFDVVNGTIQRRTTNADDWDSKDAKAQEIIVSRLADKILIHILSCKTSAEMWTKLEAIYENKSQKSSRIYVSVGRNKRNIKVLGRRNE